MATIHVDIRESVRDIIGDHISAEKTTITDESRFVDDLRVDSLDMIELVFRIEDTFDIVVPCNVVDRFVTVGDVIAFIRAQCSSPGANDFFQVA
jgi:acyl carrier protein